MARFEGYAWNALVKCQDRKHNGGFGIRLEPNDRGTIAVATDGRSLIRVQGDGNGVSARTIPVEDAKELGRVTKRGAVRIDTLDDGKATINGSIGIESREDRGYRFPQWDLVMPGTGTVTSTVHFDPKRMIDALRVFVDAGCASVEFQIRDDGKGSIYLKPSGDEPGETMVDAVVMPLVK